VKVKLILESIVSLAKEARSLLRNVSIAIRELKERRARLEAEAERLDRIRNPLKYLGK
jgi:hypothetical protein